MTAALFCNSGKILKTVVMPSGEFRSAGHNSYVMPFVYIGDISKLDKKLPPDS